MTNLFVSKRIFAAIAVFFGLASVARMGGYDQVAGTSLVVATGTAADQKFMSGPTLPPGPWDEGK